MGRPFCLRVDNNSIIQEIMSVWESSGTDRRRVGPGDRTRLGHHRSNLGNCVSCFWDRDFRYGLRRRRLTRVSLTNVKSIVERSVPRSRLIVGANPRSLTSYTVSVSLFGHCRKKSLPHTQKKTSVPTKNSLEEEKQKLRWTMVWSTGVDRKRKYSKFILRRGRP